jgi:hypothetical protein
MGFLDVKVSPPNLDAVTAGKITTLGTSVVTALSATILDQAPAKGGKTKTDPCGDTGHVGQAVFVDRWRENDLGQVRDQFHKLRYCPSS